MVLESIISVFKAEKKPYELFFLGFFYSTVAIFLSLWIFRNYASLVMVFLTVIACIPLIYNALKLEEEKDLKIDKETTLLKEHSRVLMFILFLFLGITISFTLWYVILPPDLVQVLFHSQTETIAGINNYVSGKSTVSSFSLFSKILFNNIKVLTFCILFAFVYGFGAVFILTWNASVIGVAIGNFIRVNMGAYANSAGMIKAASYFQVFSLSLLRYFIHGIPEIAAYVIGGLAGGIISIAIVRGDFKNNGFEKVLFDSSELITISLLFLLVAAFIEVYITPVLF